MSRTYTQVSIPADTFANWLSKTNDMLVVFANVVTTAANSSGDFTSGNAFISGIFGGNTVVAYNALRGGNVATSANLTITSNVTMSGSNSTFTSNVLVNGANLTVNANTFAITGVGGGNAITITSNSSITNSVFISNDLTLRGNAVVINVASFSNSVSITGAVSTSNVHSFVTATNAILSTSGANSVTHGATGNILIDSFSGTSYRGGKYVVSVKDVGGSTYQLTEILLMHDGTTGYTTEYATLRSSGTNLAIFSANLNGTTVRLYSNSQVSSSVYTINKTLMAV